MLEHTHGLIQWSRRLAFVGATMILLGNFMPIQGALEDPPSERVRWLNGRLVGSPEPPSPYTVEKTFTKIEWKAPLYLAPEPATDKLWVVLQGGEKFGPARVLRIADEPRVLDVAGDGLREIVGDCHVGRGNTGIQRKTDRAVDANLPGQIVFRDPSRGLS